MQSRPVSLRERMGRGAALWPVGNMNCPYGGADTDTCRASLSSMQRDRSLRQAYCDNEDYDDCPIFLAKMLRRG